MVTTVFTEGGARGPLGKELRRALSKFLVRAGVELSDFLVTACGSRGRAYHDFCEAIRRREPAILLVDAEGPVTDASPWQHLRASNNWSQPSGATNNQCHLMVQVMESWFLADPDALQSYYGQRFRRQDLPANPDIELVSKQDVLDGLQRSAQNTPKRGYNKGRDSFKILENIDPQKVRIGSRHAERFLQTLGA